MEIDIEDDLHLYTPYQHSRHVSVIDTASYVSLKHFL
jgi:hypothetical protein